MIRQVSVFIQNEGGKLGKVLSVLENAGINIRSLTIAETSDYGILRLINFAHGDIFMMAAYFMIFAMVDYALPWYLSLILVIICTVALGLLIETVAYRPLRSAPRMSIMISAIGVSYLLQNLATYLFSALPKAYPEIPFLKQVINIGGVYTDVVTIVTPILTILLVFALLFIVNHTKVGMAMRAVSKDFETAQLMGIKINRVISLTFVIGCFLAAVGSVLYFTPRATVNPLSGSLPGIKCFIAAVFGGIGSIPGAVVGGVVIGLSETFIKALGYSEFSDAFTFVLLIVILLVRPTGLFGEKQTDKV